MKQVLLHMGYNEIPHNNEKTLLDHCVNVSNLLESFGASKDLIQAGYFHSVYGRQHTHFMPAGLDKRHEIREIIGVEAEHLCYLNCVLKKEDFWNNFFLDQKNIFFIVNRFDSSHIAISFELILKLLNLNFANMIDHYIAKNQIILRRWWDFGMFIAFKQHLLPLAQVKLENLVRDMNGN